MQNKILMLLTGLVMNTVLGGTIAMAMGYSGASGAVTANALSILLSGAAPTSGALRAGVLKEVWTGELVKYLREGMQATWLDGIPDMSSLAENDVIHLIDVGVDPDVLINNTTYPIPIQVLNDKDIALKLDKFQTKATPITDDELYALSYDKMARVKESHGNSLNDSKFTKAAHAFCATKNTEKTPVLKTSGERDAETGRVKFTLQDMLAMKRAMDKLGVPKGNRRLVLSTDHVNDLLESEQKFKEQYNIDRNDGSVGRLYGFDIYEFTMTPFYTKAGQKKTLGTEAAEGEFQCSFAFYTKRVFKCTGSTKMYFSEAKSDPQHQQNLINFRHYFLAMPKKQDAGVVMMSDHKEA